MFYLSKIEHTLRLPPHLLSLPLEEAVKKELENIFLDKVIADLGLCISVYNIYEIEGGFIFPGEGASTYTAKFRLIIFRPFVGEIIAAKLKESDSNGLRLKGVQLRAGIVRATSGASFAPEVQQGAAMQGGMCLAVGQLSLHIHKMSLGFFEDIYIPNHLLLSPSNCKPDPTKRYEVIWTWDFDEGKLDIDGNDEIKFRVISVNYPSIPIEQTEDSKPFAPMVITGSIDDDGLGPVSWW